MKNPDTVFAEARVLETLFPESLLDIIVELGFINMRMGIDEYH